MIKRMVVNMNYLMIIIMMIAVAMNAIAAPGGSHHKITAYDYHDYLNSSIASKTFIRHEAGYDLDLVWYFDRPAPNQVVRTEISYDADGNIIRHVASTFESHNRSFDWIRMETYVPAELADTSDFDPPYVVLTDAMVEGIAWGSGGTINSYCCGENFYTDKSEVLAVEDVNVIAGMFRACLKIYRQRLHGSVTPIHRIEWYCPDMGLVKRVQGGRRLLEMTGFTLDE